MAALSPTAGSGVNKLWTARQHTTATSHENRGRCQVSKALADIASSGLCEPIKRRIVAAYPFLLRFRGLVAKFVEFMPELLNLLAKLGNAGFAAAGDE